MKNEDLSINWWKYVRIQELQPALEFFSKEKTTKILEIGGGNGLQAKLISEMGYDIISTDISPKLPTYYTVQKIDSTNLPFPSESFDLILSSHVLQHLENIEATFNEIKRVIKKNGIIIHIVPTQNWTIVTNFWHYLFIPKYLSRALNKRLRKKNYFSKQYKKNNIENESNIEKNEEKFKRLFLHPLGNNPSFIHELYYFSKFYWKNLFTNSGFKIISVKTGSDLTSGYGVFKMKFLKTRKCLGKYFSSTYCFILKIN